MKKTRKLIFVFIILLGIFSQSVVSPMTMEIAAVSPMEDTRIDSEDPCTEHKYGECVTLSHNIRQFTCTVCEAKTTFERIQTPVYYSGNIYIEENSSDCEDR